MNQNIKEQLTPLFYPRSVALVGISNASMNVGYMFLQSLIDAGFPSIYPVNPRGGKMKGLKVYPGIGDIPGEVDLAILTIPREAVPEVARECARKKIKGIVLCTSGFSEAGTEGRALEGPISQRLIGVGLETLRSVPTVMAVAGGLVKAPAILSALRSGYVTVLITDAEAAGAALAIHRGEKTADEILASAVAD